MHGGGTEQSGIVLVHSLGMTADVWDDVAERLAERVAVLTYDCRGHGASTGAPGPYSVEMFAGDLVDLLDAVGWDAAHLAGASMGGNVSLQTAILCPHRVRTLGLVDTTAWYGSDAPERWEQRARDVETQGLEPLVEFQESRWFSDRFRAQKAAPIARCREILLANDRACYAASCRMLGAFDLREGLAGLRMPAAIVVGEEDYATPVAMARQLEAAIGGATLQILPGLRHLTFVERPDIVADALSNLMSRADGVGVDG
jgi:3-oxoadipate enol-lactonase